MYGKGNADYYGAGLLAQANFETAGKNTPYIEGTIRAGRINSDWHSNDLRDVATHQRAEYDIGSNYIGAHVGAGYRWQVADNAQVDLYSQYLFNRLQDKSTKVALDPYYFNATRSSRLRLGTRATWQLGEMTKLYAGAAFEREFAGTQYASAYSLNVPAPSMKGNSALFDVGFNFSPVKLPNLTTQLGVTGYTGTRRGVGADLEVKYVF
ncbi:MAG: autotransporter outer membrane beta-barrel domain-containing protein [Neisseriaceae bacterium]|nr:autotransporter outer membrane beta-barrel domain-containing protein [Neisseriaceae bacterium]